MIDQLKQLTGKKLIALLGALTLLYLLFSWIWNPSILSDTTKKSEPAPTKQIEKVSQPLTEKETKQFIEQLKKIIAEKSGTISFTLLNESGETVYNHSPETTYQMGQTFAPLLSYVALNNVEVNKGSYFAENGQGKKDIMNSVSTMITEGNESVANELLATIGYENVLQDIREAGLKTFSIDTDSGSQIRITSDDLAKFYFKLNSGDLLNIEQTDFLMEQLASSHQFYSSSDYLPKHTKLFSQDSMSESGHYHDSGIMRINDRSYYYGLLTYEEGAESSTQADFLKSIRLLMAENL